MRRAIVIAALLAAGLGWGSRAHAQDRTDYMAVYLDGKKIGYAMESRTSGTDKVTTVEDVHFSISRGPVALRIVATVTTVETPDGKPLSFKCVQDLGLMAQSTEGTIADGKLKIVSGSDVKTMDWPKDALLPEGLRLALEKHGLKEGTSLTADVFDPSSMSVLQTTLTVGPKKMVDLLGRVVELNEVKMTMKGPTGTLAGVGYQDQDGNALKVVMPMLGMNLELVACDKQFAMSPNDAGDFLNAMLIECPSPLTDRAEAASITFELAPRPGQKLGEIPATDNQTVQTGTAGVTVTVKPVAAPAGATFPYTGNDKTALAAMKPTRFLQSDDALVAKLAKEAVGDTKDAAQAAKRIEKFVRSYIKNKNLNVGYASAAEVAKSAEGDCSEHAVLLAAMCRAVGIPAQVAVGMAYADEFGGRKNVMGPHAWVHAYVGGKWIGLDAALPGGFDAAHLCLAGGDGDMGDFFGVVNTLGCFDVKNATVQPK